MPFLTAQRVLVMLFAYATGLSFALTYLAARGLTSSPELSLGSSLVFSLLIFMWYWIDSQARGFRRPPWLSVAIVAVAVFAVPYYLFRSRAMGQRAKAFGNLFAVIGLLILSMIVGGLPATLL
jgi:hypothetical protein